MPNIADPWKNPKAWESVSLRGRDQRGVVRNFVIPNCEVNVRAGGLKEGEANVGGEDGITRTFLGYKDAESTITATATNYKELAVLQAVLEAYRPKRLRAGQASGVLEAIHPKFTLHNIKYVYIFDVQTSDFTLEDGVVFTFELREWQPEEKRSTTSSSTRDNKGGANKDQPAQGQNRTGQNAASTSQRPQPPLTKAQKAQQNKPSQQATQQVGRLMQSALNGERDGRNMAQGVFTGRRP
jgi:hypothetical protein